MSYFPLYSSALGVLLSSRQGTMVKIQIVKARGRSREDQNMTNVTMAAA